MSTLTLLDHFKQQHHALIGLLKVEPHNGCDIQILPGVFANRTNVNAFYTRYVFPHKQRVALCGINPGRLGAGISGVPFVDMAFLSELLKTTLAMKTERSAQFFRKVVQHYGCERFYASVYVTNFSAFGFQKGRKNLNYYDLPNEIQDKLGEWFKAEMELMRISEIIPCSQVVEYTLRKLQAKGLITAKVHKPLPHPNWSAFPSHEHKAFESYCDKLDLFLNP